MEQEVCAEVDPLRLSFRVGSCPDKLYNLQQQCFEEKNKRPTFAEMKTQIEEIMKEIPDEMQVKIRENSEVAVKPNRK